MAWETIKCSCGHEMRVQLYHSNEEREWKAKRIAEGLCDDCRAKEHAEENAKAADQARAYGLPTLYGTDKQVAWAETIRIDALKRFDTQIPKLEDLVAKCPEDKLENLHREYAEIMALVDAAKAMRKASWWIDRRGMLKNDMRVMLQMISEMPEIKNWIQMQKEAAQAPAEAAPQPPKKEARENTVPLLRSEDGEVRGVVKVVVERKENTPEAGILSARYERDDRFWKVMKAADLSWDKEHGEYRRSIGQMRGPLTARAAELIHRLLAAGFAVRCADPDAVAMAEEGAEKIPPEHKRWIGVCSDKKNLWATLPRGDSSEATIRRIGGKWDREEAGFRLPESAIKDVDELVRLMDYRITTGAQKVIAAYWAELDAAKAIKAEKPAPKEYKDGLKDVLASSREVLDNLKDE